MKRRLLRATAMLAVVVGLAGAGAVAYVYRVCYSHLDQVEATLAALPPGEASPPPEFTRAVLTLEPNSYVSWVARSFVSETFPERLPMYEWHLRNFLWGALLARKFSQPQLISLYAHLLPFRDGKGLTYGAQHHFASDPAALSLRELVELLVISGAPAIYSRPENRGRRDEQVERRMALLASPAA